MENDTDNPNSIWSISAWRRPFPASVFSTLCTVIYDITILLWVGSSVVAYKSWGPMAVSGIGFCEGIPVLLLGPIAGVIVDRSNKKRILVGASLVQAFAAGIMFITVINWRSMPLGVVLTLSFTSVIILTAASQFFSQARMAMIAVTVPLNFRNTAFSIIGSMASIIQIVGPPLAAPLLFTIGPKWAILANSISFLVAALTYGTTQWNSSPSPSQERAQGNFLESLREGVALIGGDLFLRSILVAITMTGLILGVTEVLEIYFVSESLGAPQKDLGILMMFLAVGTLCGTTLAPVIAKRLDVAHIFVGSIALTGFLLLALSRSTNLVEACIFELLLALPLGVVNTLFSPMVMGRVEQGLVGRVFGVFNVLPTAANLLSMAGGGILVSTVLRGFHAQILGFSLHPVDFIYSIAGFALLLVATYVRKGIFCSYNEA